ncbi:MAG: hypothetical protein U9R74_07145 [Pseudomonadota bacterium]|nr:hypothetical protein [Pseudomonadota bacterium]
MEGSDTLARRGDLQRVSSGEKGNARLKLVVDFSSCRRLSPYSFFLWRFLAESLDYGSLDMPNRARLHQ